MGWQFKEAANVEQRIAFNRLFTKVLHFLKDE